MSEDTRRLRRIIRDEYLERLRTLLGTMDTHDVINLGALIDEDHTVVLDAILADLDDRVGVSMGDDVAELP